jgi:ribose-phosphate pyrophosphokinase
MENEPALFAFNSSRPFGEQVAQRLGVSLSPLEEREFEDGEHKARPLVGVRNQDVFVIQSLYADQQQSSNDKLCRLLFFIGALKDAGAARVTAIVPYLAYARKDRKTKARDPVTTRYVATLFEAVGTDVVVTMDVHNLAAYQNAFRCRTEHLEANKLFVKYFIPLLKDDEVVVVSPDAGGIKRAESFRHMLAASMAKPIGAAFAEKHRSGDVVSGDLFVGDVKGKSAVIVDDLISSGTTLMRAAQACQKLGATRVFAVATHGLFAGEANSVLAQPAMERIVTTDTVSAFRLNKEAVKSEVTILSTTALFAEAIRRLHDGGSLTAMLE